MTFRSNLLRQVAALPLSHLITPIVTPAPYQAIPNGWTTRNSVLLPMWLSKCRPSWFKHPGFDVHAMWAWRLYGLHRLCLPRDGESRIVSIHSSFSWCRRFINIVSSVEANDASNPATRTTALSDPSAQERDANNGTGEEIRHAVAWSNFLLELPTVPGTDAIDYTAWMEQSKRRWGFSSK